MIEQFLDWVKQKPQLAYPILMAVGWLAFGWIGVSAAIAFVFFMGL